MGDWGGHFWDPCGSDISGPPLQEGEEAVSFTPEDVGTPWNRSSVGLGTPELLERLEQGPVWEDPMSELKRGQGEVLEEQFEQRHRRG